MLKDHLSYRLQQYRHERPKDVKKLTSAEAAEQFSLTRQEQTILRKLMSGMDNEQICDELAISINTLKKHILNMYRKLGIKNRTQMFKLIKEKE